MTEDQIERIAENKMDHLDREFMSGRLDSETYDQKVKELNSWAQTEYRKISLAPFRMEV